MQSVWRTMCEVPGGTVGDVDHLRPQTRQPLLGLGWRHAYFRQHVNQVSAVGGQRFKRCLLLPPQRLVSRKPAGRACAVPCVRCQVARWGTPGDHSDTVSLTGATIYRDRRMIQNNKQQTWELCSKYTDSPSLSRAAGISLDSLTLCSLQAERGA